jgi:hypothetical protein
MDSTPVFDSFDKALFSSVAIPTATPEAETSFTVAPSRS